MNMYINAYNRLLADIGDITKTPLCVPCDLASDWVLKEAPKLDKQLLGYLESGELFPEFPDWLTPLSDLFRKEHDPLVLRYLRQCLSFCYKVEHEPTNEQQKEAQSLFEETDAACEVWETAMQNSQFTHLLATARRTVSRVIGRINWQEITPQHGPGAVFPPTDPSEKSLFLTYYPRIQQYYPYDKFFWCLPSFWVDIMVNENKGSIVELEDITAKLTCVPKDSRGPRLICVHPKEAIWIQQGQRLLLEAAIDRSFLKGKINFTDQTVNGRMALASSLDKEYCTLDLKEASDRISMGLVRHLFGDYTYSVLSCARANKVQLLDGRVIDLKKWAPMGNCLTFPVQSLIFWSVVHAGILCKYGEICTDIYVFGDDIIFPTKWYEGALYGLLSIGCVPNVSKTFRKGFFRESCGVDAYHGIDVTPLRTKKGDIACIEDAQAWCTLAKRARIIGYEYLSSYIYQQVRLWNRGRLYFTNDPDCQGLCEYIDRDLGWLFQYSRVRFNSKLHYWETQSFLIDSAITSISYGDWNHLQDSLWSISREKDYRERATQYAVPHRIRLKRGWIPSRK